MLQSTGAHSHVPRGHRPGPQARRRAVWGGNFSYTYSRLNDNQFGQGNYYSSAPGLQNNYTVVPDSPYYNPDQEYGRSLLDSPHKVVICADLPTAVRCRQFLAGSTRSARRLAGHAGDHVLERVPDGRQPER